jgi:hypothetical protein
MSLERGLVFVAVSFMIGRTLEIPLVQSDPLLGMGPRMGRPPPEGASVGYPLDDVYMQREDRSALDSHFSRIRRTIGA